jgi:hypothetical protein
MTWFNYASSDTDITQEPATPSYLSPPLKRSISFPSIEQQIHANDWLFVENSSQPINQIYLNDLSTEEQDHSYVVVCENESNSYDATPLSTTIVDGYIYFKSKKDHQPGQILNYQYSLYYGKDYIKYIEATPIYAADTEDYEYIYIQNSQATINYYLDSDNSQNYAQYSTPASSVDFYQTTIDSTSQEKYLMNYFNKGIDWIDNVSQRIGSKISANFEGPNIKVVGTKSPNSGIFKYRIIEKSEEIEIVKINWTNVDCFSTSNQLTELISLDNLDYKQYYIEIETLSDKNSLSTGNSINIEEIQFLKNYYLSLGEEQINPDLSFISIGGLR